MFTDRTPTPLDEVKKDRRFATTLARGLSVLRAFRASDDGLGNQEISERTGLPKSTVSRLTFTLQTLGYLSHEGRRDRYRLGPALLALGNVAASSTSFVETGTPIMQALANETGTLVVLAVRDERKLMLVNTWRPRGVSSIWLETGHRIPVKGSSSGQALLAALAEAEFQEVAALLDGENGMTPEIAEELRNEAYAQLVSVGYVIARPETRFASTVNAVAVPFRSYELSEPVVFACGALPKDLSDERMKDEVGPKLCAAVRELERATGQSPVLSQRG